MIWDCFPFWNEFDQLDIRLDELKGIVDYHVLVEANVTHQGAPKPYLFEQAKDRYKDFPIIHIKADDCPRPDPNPWMIEHHQRDCILRGLKEAAPSDIVLISDADEIPEHEALKVGIKMLVDAQPIGNCPPIVQFRQRIFYNYLNVEKRNHPWYGTRMVKHSTLLGTVTPNMLRPNPSSNPGALTAPGGWHFSWLGGHERIKQKFEAFAHDELREQGLNDTAYIKDCLAHNFAPHNREPLHVTPIDESFPQIIVQAWYRKDPRWLPLIRTPSAA